MVLSGLYVWYWPKHGWSRVDPARVAAGCRTLGIAGLIPHNRFEASRWLYSTPAGGKPVDRVKPILAEGLKVAVGIGRAGGLDDEPKERCSAAIQEALALPFRLPVMLDWEGKYDLLGGREKAAWIAEDVLRVDPTASERVVDCPWWAPLFYRDPNGRNHPTHPSAPYVEFGRLATKDRYVQAYGQKDGASLSMLYWARSEGQYPAIARKGAVAPWTIRGAFTAYGRSWEDVTRTTLAEPDSILWDYEEMDAACRLGLRVVVGLRERGYGNPGGLERFAREANAGDVSTVPRALGL